MAAPLSRVAVIGGGGILGSFIVAALKKAPQFTVSVITRNSSTTKFDDSLNIIKVADDYPSSDLEKAFSGQDVIVCAFNHRANAAQNTMIDVAVKVGVKRFIPADFGSNAESPEVVDLFPPLRGKQAAVQYCKSKESDTFSWTSVITGLFIDQAIENTFMGYNLKERTATIWESGNDKFSCSTRATVAKTIIQILGHPDKTKNRYVYTSSFEITQNDILASLEKTMGTKFTVNPVKYDDMVADGKAGFARGDIREAGKLALAISYSGKFNGDYAKAGKLANAELGVPQENLDDVLSGLVKQIVPQ